ncbi:EF-hand calcium-binding domain-containing protein 7 isoform X3 [Narcine bancroftii]|uniref:EF-hand calcium-binding domain-containing protein 7 isoform X3 n=1 Tax=Narcine bancroftii TaxID=1343680 RepID=UPI003831A7A2
MPPFWKFSILYFLVYDLCYNQNNKQMSNWQELGTPATTKSAQSEAGQSQYNKEESFYRNCRASYLAVFGTSLENITSKDQLCLALQQAGRNPSRMMLGKYWTPYTKKLNFDDFCEILKKEKPTDKNELIKAFRKIDLNNDGYISQEELYKVLTTKGEKMTCEEVQMIMDEADVNNDGKLHYNENWQHAWSKGCFFLDDDGGIVSHQYKLELQQTTNILLTIRPLNLSQNEEKLSPWMNVDTALYVLKDGDDSEALEVVCATELREKERFGWKGELRSGVYHVIPFTSGCKLKKQRKSVIHEAKLVHRENGDLMLTKEFRVALSDVFEVIDLDGNGLLSFEEYNLFELRTSGEKCDREAWAMCRETFDTKKNQLTRQGFMELNLMEANDRGGDPGDLWVTLESMGYNRALEMQEACPFMVDIYAENSKLKLTPISLEVGGSLLNSIICKIVTSKGEAKTIKGYNAIVIYNYKTETLITSVIENKSESNIIIHVNNEKSKNCVSSRGLSTFAMELSPQTTTVCQHVMPVDERREWIYNCTESIVT